MAKMNRRIDACPPPIVCKGVVNTMAKSNVALSVRGRKPTAIDRDFLVDKLSRMDDKNPTPLSQVGISAYFMRKIEEERGYIEPAPLKVTPGRGRPKKAYRMTPRGRSWLKFHLKKGALQKAHLADRGEESAPTAQKTESKKSRTLN